ncbi:small ribosomal subunit protein uS17m-like [Physella acuta]|uniref:small ribosomal subunit protein uS17m-like n=1 Tax=Physella acuta TaxID=109671 RepID=UPI0027DCA826|nr:small ribosomal subunit protein uS17m-like [Physella acuta]XP_059141939.1 small ribosomal subunit protein uS17m-like [Physella acuta]XP_059141940.1 small ribosomal subunit protein uS17m-like [Physella acuta]XP_059141941.1 small ribosomal subunit protein uS17m-like [Physella acuta]
MASRIMMLGHVLHREALKPRIVNVRVIEQVFDVRLNMFFPEPRDFKVLEGEDKVKSGDIVRFEKLEERMSVDVGHKIVEVVFPLGFTVDPVTGRRCRGKKFIDEKARVEEAKRIATIKAKDNYVL